MQQNCKKGLCLAFLFSAMFLTGWEIAGMRSRQTKETAAVAYEAGNWGLGFGAEGTQPTGNATSAELAQYDAHYVGDPSGKVLYLTFDCGFENGNTPAIHASIPQSFTHPLAFSRFSCLGASFRRLFFSVVLCQLDKHVLQIRFFQRHLKQCILRRSAATGAVISGRLATQRPPVIRWSF